MRGTDPARPRIGDYLLVRDVTGTAAGDEMVFEATHIVLPRRVLLRVTRPDQDDPRAAAVRLMREAYFLEAMRHAGVPRVFECGRLGNRAWIAIELVEGEALPRRLGIAAALHLVRELAAILAHAHEHGIVHGGLRPSAIVYGANGPSLIDWSSARTDYEPSVDIAALGALACDLIAQPLPTRIAALLGEMQAYDPRARPNAEYVAARAGELAAEADAAAQAAEADAVPVLVEEIVIPPPSQGVVLAVLKMRS